MVVDHRVNDFLGFVGKVKETTLTSSILIPDNGILSKRGATEDQLRDAWNKSARNYSKVETLDAFGATMHALLDSLGLPTTSQKWLSLGAGPGFYEIYLAKKQDRLSIVLLDFAQSFVDLQAQIVDEEAKINPQIKARISSIKGSMNRLSNVGEGFNTILCINAIQWDTNWKLTVSEISRVLAKSEGSSVFLTLAGIRVKNEDGSISRSEVDPREAIEEFEGVGLRLKAFGGLLIRRGQNGLPTERTYMLFQRDNQNVSSWMERLKNGDISWKDYKTDNGSTLVYDHSHEISQANDRTKRV